MLAVLSLKRFPFKTIPEPVLDEPCSACAHPQSLGAYFCLGMSRVATEHYPGLSIAHLPVLPKTFSHVNGEAYLGLDAF